MITLPGAVVAAALQASPALAADDNLATLAAEASATRLVASATTGCGASWPESTYVRRIRNVAPVAELDGAESLAALLDAVVAETA